MFLAKPFARLFRSRRTPRVATLAINDAVRPAVEELESRRLLSTETYTVPASVGGTPVSYIELRKGFSEGRIDVYLNHATSASHTFTNLSGTDLVQATGSGVTLVDKVPAAWKEDPNASPDPIDVTVKFTSGSASTLEVDAGPTDEIIRVPTSSATGTDVKVTDTSSLDPSTDVTATDTMGTGVTSLVLRTNDNVASTYADPLSGVELATDGAYVNVPSFYSSYHLTVDTGAGTYDTVILGSGEDASVVDATVNTGAGHDKVTVTSDEDRDGVATADVDFGAGTGTGDGLGLGNSLEVDGGGTATLADNTGDGHTVALDAAHVGAFGTLVVGHKSTLGTVLIDQFGAALVQAPNTTINSLTVDGTVEVDDATTTIPTLQVDSGGAITFTPTGHAVVTTATVGGTATVEGHSQFTTVTVSSGGVMTFTNTSGTSTVGTATVDGTLDVQAPTTLTTLNVDGGGTATFESSTGSTVSTATIDGTLDVRDATQFTTLTVDTSGTAVFEGSGGAHADHAIVDGTATVEAPTTFGTLAGSGTTEYTGTSGTSTIGVVEADAMGNPTANVTVDSGATLVVGGGTHATDRSYLDVLRVAGTTDLDSPVTLLDLEQTDGLVDLNQAGTWRDTPLANTIDAIDISGGLLDVHGQDVLTDTTETTIVDYLVSGFNGGDWLGATGIISSYAVGNHNLYAVGFASDADNGYTGLSLATGQVILRPVTVGDTNLNGSTTYGDYHALLGSYGQTSGQFWVNGDTNYDGAVGYGDYQNLLAAFGQSFPT